MLIKGKFDTLTKKFEKYPVSIKIESNNQKFRPQYLIVIEFWLLGF